MYFTNVLIIKSSNGLMEVETLKRPEHCANELNLGIVYETPYICTQLMALSFLPLSHIYAECANV